MKLIRTVIFLLVSANTLPSNAQISGVVNSYFKVTNVIPSYNGIRVANITGLNVNDRVLIIQMKGAVINETDASTFGNITSINGAGSYEFATICGFLNDTVIFERELKNIYDYTKAVQLVKVPVYSDVTVTGTLKAQDWNAVTETGGVVAIAATGTITLNANISADSAGYKGGALQSFSNCNFLTVADNYIYSPLSVLLNNDNGTYKGEGINNTITNKEGGKGKQSNGGGGGNNHNTGGGGGANYGTGGNGGRYTGTGSFPCNGVNVGIGGLSLSSYGYTLLNNKIFMGGGGGAGHDNNGFGTPGGKGGGIVFVECADLVGNGHTISANGSQGINISNVVPNEARGDGGGGGGAGGTVMLNVLNYTGNTIVQAKGADGSKAGFQAQCPGPGGGGGGGVIWANSVLPINVSTSVAGGVAGIINDAVENPPCELTTQLATAGSNGAVFTNFSITYGNQYNCLGVLSSTDVLNWSGRKLHNTVVLKWEISNPETIDELFLERKMNQSSFKTINHYTEIQKGSYSFTDANGVFPVVYRLVIVSDNGLKTYTRSLAFDEKQRTELKIYPNPVKQELQLQLPVLVRNVSFTIYDYSGRIVQVSHYKNSTSQQVLTLPVQNLKSGVYFISCSTDDVIWKATFLKR